MPGARVSVENKSKLRLLLGEQTIADQRERERESLLAICSAVQVIASDSSRVHLHHREWVACPELMGRLLSFRFNYIVFWVRGG